jgi:hypothetical protein
MMRLILAFLLLVTTAAHAQQQRTFTLQITETDLVVIGRALEGLPYRDAAPVLARLQQQIAEQAKQQRNRNRNRKDIMSITKSETLTQSVHANICNASEGTRQSAVAAAIGNAATIKSLEVTHYRACLASALATGCQPGVFIRALMDLRADGV